MQKETQTLGKEYWKDIYADIQKEFQKGVENKYHTVKGENNRSRRKLIPKSIEVITERKPFSTKVTATLSIKLELTQELTPKQIEYILTSHFKRI